MRRMTITTAVLALTVLTIAASDSPSFARVGPGSGHTMEMDDGHGSGHESGNKGTKHGKNARVADGAREIEVNANSFAFTPNEISIGAKESVAIVLRSEDVLHDFVVKGKGHIVSAKGQKTARGGLTMTKPGTYKFWCSVSGHRAAGMRGTIIVT